MNSFKTRLAALKRSKRFLVRGESGALARELEDMLEELKREVSEPRAGLDALAAFYRADKAVFERCDDSNGYVGDVFREIAPELFSFYAKQYDDKKWLADLIFKLYADDDNGVRYCLLSRMSEFVPDPLLRKTVDKFWALPEQSENSSFGGNIHTSIAIKSLAVQLKDPVMLERACRTFALREGLGTAAHLEIATLHLKCGK